MKRARKAEITKEREKACVRESGMINRGRQEKRNTMGRDMVS